jgi:peroxiredoxin
MVQDADSLLYMVFDDNNDEDLSNDAHHAFKTKRFGPPAFDKEFIAPFADGDVTVDYYDGKTVQQTTYGVRFQQIKGYEKRGTGSLSSVNGYFGTVAIDGATYKVGLPKSPDVEFNKHESIWIDLNQNGIHDYAVDFIDQLYLPVTIGNQTYQLKDIPRFGGYLTLEACDPAVIPPIGVGLPAPDFTETNYDSTAQVTLSDYKGKFVALNFWSCDGSFGLEIINKVHQKFKDRGDFQILTIGPYAPEYLRGKAKDITLQWPHVHGLFEVKARTLYQVSGHNVTFLISPDGKILDKRLFAQADELIEMVEKYMK